MTVSPRDADVIREAIRGLHTPDVPDVLGALDRLVARVHALERALGEARKFAKAAKSQAAAPDYDEEAIRAALWLLVEVVLARAVVLEGARQDKSFGGDETSPVVPQRDSTGELT